jgi:hypothetical protein
MRRGRSLATDEHPNAGTNCRDGIHGNAEDLIMTRIGASALSFKAWQEANAKLMRLQAELAGKSVGDPGRKTPASAQLVQAVENARQEAGDLFAAAHASRPAKTDAAARR